MCKATLNIWGRKFIIPTIFEAYGDQETLPEQERNLRQFLNASTLLDSALPQVKQYCMEDENMGDVKQIDNIFRFVIPKSIYVKRDTRERMIALLCDYKFDIEHGIAIVFANEKFKEIVKQGDI